MARKLSTGSLSRVVIPVTWECVCVIFWYCRGSGSLSQGVFMERKMWSSYEELRERLNSILSTLSQREQDVLKMRFGLDDGKSHTIKEVCERFGMTRLEVRTVEAKALRRVRRKVE